jgi:hypothetical protein
MDEVTNKFEGFSYKTEDNIGGHHGGAGWANASTVVRVPTQVEKMANYD